MKKILIILLLSSFLFLGCSKDDNISGVESLDEMSSSNLGGGGQGGGNYSDELN